MLELLLSGGASIKTYLYGALIAIFLSMAATIYYLNGENNRLSGELAVANQKVDNSKSLIASMIGTQKVTDDVQLFIDTGLSVTLNEHEKVEDKLRKEYENYLLESKKEELCSGYCEELFSDKTCPISGPGIPSVPGKTIPVNETKKRMKKAIINSAWESFCVSNRTDARCKQ